MLLSPAHFKTDRRKLLLLGVVAFFIILRQGMLWLKNEHLNYFQLLTLPYIEFRRFRL